jgi:hypothetical protein
VVDVGMLNGVDEKQPNSKGYFFRTASPERNCVKKMECIKVTQRPICETLLRKNAAFVTFYTDRHYPAGDRKSKRVKYIFTVRYI